jgi:quinol monooxygenase YgiN
MNENPMFANITMTIKPERREVFLAAVRDLLPAGRAEPDCIYLHVGQSVTDPDLFVVSEGWRDRDEYLNVIRQKPHFQIFVQISESSFAQPPSVLPLIPVEPDL